MRWQRLIKCPPSHRRQDSREALSSGGRRSGIPTSHIGAGTRVWSAAIVALNKGLAYAFAHVPQQTLCTFPRCSIHEGLCHPDQKRRNPGHLAQAPQPCLYQAPETSRQNIIPCLNPKPAKLYTRKQAKVTFSKRQVCSRRHTPSVCPMHPTQTHMSSPDSSATTLSLRPRCSDG